MTRKITAVALDKDGVTFNSERLYAEALQNTLEQLGLPKNSHLATKCCGLTAEKTAKILREYLGEAIDLENLYRLWFENRDALIKSQGMPFMLGADQLIEELYQQGYPLALVTSDSLDNVLHDFDRCSKPYLLQHFSAIITVDNVAEPKPSPEPYLRAAAYLGVDPHDMLAVEDSDPGARAALQAGYLTLLLPDQREPDPQIAKAVYKIITHHQQALEVIYEYSA